ncbi:MAG: IS5/IS1182 family transposase [Dactylosporangium sp.]|nr:IS5/IS1182 family transposase [Dactylosporangium sp.]NNJ61418.1 IS5/IS1182 family transposase [Dactylosporangium sp.]
MSAYRSTIDIPRELVQYLGRLLAAERRALGTRRGTRSLTCFHQTLLVLVWFRKGEDPTLLGAGLGISRATVYRYVAEGKVLTVQASDLHDALQRVAAEGWSHVILDGKLFATDRLTETVTSVNGETIDAWYSGKHHDFGANIQAIIRPDGLPIWTSDAPPGRLHDLTYTNDHDILAALYWAASQLDLPTLADSAYEGAGQGVHTPFKQPGDGHQLDVDNRAYNSLQRSLRCLGERGFAILTGRWKVTRHITASPRSIGDIVRAALHLTHFEYRYLPNSC